MNAEDIGAVYEEAAEKLRALGWYAETAGGGEEGISWHGHVFYGSRDELPPDAELFARQIGRLVDQVLGVVDDESFESIFFVDLEAFSTLRVWEEDVWEGRKRLAYGYVPVRLREYLKYTSAGKWLSIYGQHTIALLRWNNRISRPEELRMVGIEWTSGGPRIRRSVGWVTGVVVLAVSSIPVVYLALRVGKTDVESVIQTALAIVAGTLLVVASPLHRFLFRNWGITEALSGRMTLDVDTVGNIREEEERRAVGIGLIVDGQMRLISGEVGYGACYGREGLNPGEMMLGILTRSPGHTLVVDQSGALVLMYGDGNAVQLVVAGEARQKRPLIGRRYTSARDWYVLNVEGAEQFLVG